MAKKGETGSRYGVVRTRKTPPHVALGQLRSAMGLTLDDVIARLAQETGNVYTRGAVSAVENGLRGASTEFLAALCAAYGLPAGAITTEYTPRAAPTFSSADDQQDVA